MGPSRGRGALLAGLEDEATGGGAVADGGVAAAGGVGGEGLEER